MSLGGYKLSKLWKEHQLVDKAWREMAGNYWRDFIHNVKEKGFTILFNDSEHTVEIVKDNRKIVSLHFLKEMINEDFDIRFRMELNDKYLVEELEEGKKVLYHGKEWTIVKISGDYVTIRKGAEGSQQKRVHRKVLEK